MIGIGGVSEMRLQLILPRVVPSEIPVPGCCPHCEGKQFRFHQAVEKPLRDTVYPQVIAHRYYCFRCQCSWRVYPQGVSCEHASQRVKSLGVMLYLLGLSYGAVSLALEAPGGIPVQEPGL